MEVIYIEDELPKVEGFYPTNVGIQYFESGIWLEPTCDSEWEPTLNDKVTAWVDIPQRAAFP